jgi:hypothetical protein
MLVAVWSIDCWASAPLLARPAREAREKALSMSSSDVGVVGRFSKIMDVDRPHGIKRASIRA